MKAIPGRGGAMSMSGSQLQVQPWGSEKAQSICALEL